MQFCTGTTSTQNVPLADDNENAKKKNHTHKGKGKKIKLIVMGESRPSTMLTTRYRCLWVKESGEGKVFQLFSSRLSDKTFESAVSFFSPTDKHIHR